MVVDGSIHAKGGDTNVEKILQTSETLFVFEPSFPAPGYVQGMSRVLGLNEAFFGLSLSLQAAGSVQSEAQTNARPRMPRQGSDHGPFWTYPSNIFEIAGL